MRKTWDSLPVIIALQGAFLRKGEMLKKVRFELGKLLALHGQGKSSGPAAGGKTSANAHESPLYGLSKLQMLTVTMFFFKS